MMKNTNFYLRRLILLIGTVVIILSHINCKKFIEIAPPDSGMNAVNVYADDAIAASALTGIYTNLSKGNSSTYAWGGDFTSLSLFAALSADELKLFDLNLQTYFPYYSNSLSANPGSSIATANYWNTIYPYAFVANSAIEGLASSKTLTPAIKQQLLGEAFFIRAFCNFYLVNLYGDVPLALSSDWKINSSLSRESAAQVYEQIIADLKDAEQLLSSDYLSSDAVTPTTARVRPNKWVAAALLARVYLYNGNYEDAEAEASKLINNTTFQIVSLNDVFLKNSNEAIWQLQAVGTGTNSNTGEGKVFILPGAGPSDTYPVYLSNYLVNTFEPGDKRKTNWISSVTVDTITYYYPYKYKIGAVNTSAKEYSTVLRLAEQYLIRAEARAMQGNLQDAIDDVNYIRLQHAGLSTPLPLPSNQENAIYTILHERQVELFTEWGHRWLDLKRTKTVDATMTSITPTKGGTWEATDQLYPVPESEIIKAPQLTQNAGY